MDFRFRSIHFSLSKLLNIYKIDPELRDKFSNIISMKKEDFKKSFENIAYNINSKNEIYNLGIMMRKFIGKNKIKKGDNFHNLLISMFKEKSEERISWEDYINHPFFKTNNINADSNKYK